MPKLVSPVYWILDLNARQLEVYSNPIAGVYPATRACYELHWKRGAALWSIRMLKAT